MANLTFGWIAMTRSVSPYVPHISISVLKDVGEYHDSTSTVGPTTRACTIIVH